MFGFQTFKEPGDGATITEQHAKWCCLDGQGDKPWVIANGYHSTSPLTDLPNPSLPLTENPAPPNT
jgi:hypothetical protein